MGDAGDARWSEMPQHLVERIMERLPMDCSVRFRTVCKRWNDFLSSKYFIAATKQQCLLLCMPNTQMRGSAGGLLLLDILTQNSFFSGVCSMTCVCNPVSRSCFWLPQTSSVKYVMAKGIVAGDDMQSYKVVVVGKSATNSFSAEVYDSCTNLWTTATAQLPDNLVMRNDHMLFCNGFLYCLTAHGGILAYNIQNGTSTMLPMPVANATTNNNKNMWPRLVTCKNLLLVVAAMEENYILHDVIIWKFHPKQTDKNNIDCCWSEIGRMPKSLCEDFSRGLCSKWFECVGVEGFMCFRAHESMQVLAYCISQRSWTWLPKCPDSHTYCQYMHLRSLAFEPMPDMKT